jgi:hypothetical protein
MIGKQLPLQFLLIVIIHVDPKENIISSARASTFNP